jgi:enoyl-CoA hydratase/carnithine racemase
MRDPSEFKFEAIDWKLEDFLLSVKLNRPDKKNAINAAMARELVFLLTYAKSTELVRVVSISAEGSVFSAGGDLSAMRGDSQESSSTVPSLADNPDASNADLNLIASSLRNLNKPSIVIANGSVFAGALLIICNSTHVYAAPDVKFSAPEIHRGLWPYMVMAGLFRLVSKRNALDWIMEGEPICAKTAEAWGLINKVYEQTEILEEVDKKIKKLINSPPKTMSLGLEAFNKQEDMEFDQALPYLAEMLNKTIESGDANEGIEAFFEKRKPSWSIKD